LYTNSKNGKRERERKTDSRVQSTRAQIIHNVRKVTEAASVADHL